MSDITLGAKVDTQDTLLRTRILPQFTDDNLTCYSLIPDSKFFDNILYLLMQSSTVQTENKNIPDVIASTVYGSPYAWYVFFYINGILSLDHFNLSSSILVPSSSALKEVLLNTDATTTIPVVDEPDLTPLDPPTFSKIPKKIIEQDINWISTIISEGLQ